MSTYTKRVAAALVLLSVLVGVAWHPATASVPELRLETEPLYKTFVQVLGYIRGYYVDDVPLDKLLRGAISGMMSELDPYSVYFPRQEYESFVDSTVTGSFGGIGIHIDVKEGYITVIAPIPGTPADVAGLKAGDKILEVDGKSAKGWTVDTASAAIRGKPGTKVKLKIQKTTGKIEEIEITRALIKLPTVETLIVENGKAGIIKLYRFTEDTADEVGAALRVMRERGVKGIILDLRDNPGGLLSSAVDVLRYFIPKGPAVHIIDRSGKVTTLTSGTDEPRLPFVVLINEGSASASEIVAGAIKDYGVGFIVGQRSFGKGSVQTLIDLPNDEGMKLTTHRYVTPNKNKIDGVGVMPDQELPAEDWEDPLKAPPVVRPKEFKLGDKGPEVLQVERALVALGYLKAAKGMYTEAVFTAVGKYQMDKGLHITGYVNSETAQALNKDLAYRSLGGMDRQTWEALQILKLKARI